VAKRLTNILRFVTFTWASDVPSVCGINVHMIGLNRASHSRRSDIDTLRMGARDIACGQVSTRLHEEQESGAKRENRSKSNPTHLSLGFDVRATTWTVTSFFPPFGFVPLHVNDPCQICRGFPVPSLNDCPDSVCPCCTTPTPTPVPCPCTNPGP
jgi:hypothetical protein